MPHSQRSLHENQPSRTSQRVLDGFLAPFGVSVDPELLDLALTHRSWAYENGESPDNERLEFLGDSILGQGVTVQLYREFPDMREGELAKRRAGLVSTVALAQIARGLGLGAYLRLGNGEEQTGGRDKDSLLANAVEAVIGAVYLSNDPVTAEAFVQALVAPLLCGPDTFLNTLDPKTAVQQEAAQLGLDYPNYEITAVGPDHARVFTARVSLAEVTGTGTGSSKKNAELAAAQDLLLQLRQSPERGRS